MPKKISCVIILLLLVFSTSCAGQEKTGIQADTTEGVTTAGPAAAVSELPCQHASDPDTEQDDRLRIVCLGDSVTAGVFELVRTGTFYFGGYVYDEKSAYPALLENMLRNEYGCDAAVYNAGISGDTAGDGAARLERDVFIREPEIITVCFGLNDVCLEDPEFFKSELEELFAAIRAWNPEVKIFYLTPNMLATYVHDETKDDYVNYAMANGNVYITKSGMLDRYMETARSVCEEHDIPVCDAYAYWKQLYAEGTDITELLATHVTHPSREMHVIFARMLAESMREHNIIG